MEFAVFTGCLFGLFCGAFLAFTVGDKWFGPQKILKGKLEMPQGPYVFKNELGTVERVMENLIFDLLGPHEVRRWSANKGDTPLTAQSFPDIASYQIFQQWSIWPNDAPTILDAMENLILDKDIGSFLDTKKYSFLKVRFEERRQKIKREDEDSSAGIANIRTRYMSPERKSNDEYDQETER
jgi:hypothetical protein